MCFGNGVSRHCAVKENMIILFVCVGRQKGALKRMKCHKGIVGMVRRANPRAIVARHGYHSLGKKKIKNKRKSNGEGNHGVFEPKQTKKKW